MFYACCLCISTYSNFAVSQEAVMHQWGTVLHTFKIKFSHGYILHRNSNTTTTLPFDSAILMTWESTNKGGHVKLAVVSAQPRFNNSKLFWNHSNNIIWPTLEIVCLHNLVVWCADVVKFMVFLFHAVSCWLLDHIIVAILFAVDFLHCMIPCKSLHRIMQWFGLEGTLKTI